MQTFLTRLTTAWRRFTCRLHEARRLRRDMRELRRMDAHELRDIGFPHPAMALAAAASAPSRCI